MCCAYMVSMSVMSRTSQRSIRRFSDEVLDLLSIRATDVRAEQGRGLYQLAGFLQMHEFQFDNFQRLAGRFQIYGLPTGHAARASSIGEQSQYCHLCFGGDARKRLCRHMKCQGLQGVADQKCGRFVILNMACWLAAAQDVVVHCRQIVMHQRINVNDFHCARHLI